MSRVTPLRRLTTSSIRNPLGQRSGDRELLDAPAVDPAELYANLRDLARVNRLPGGARTSIAAIERLAPPAAALRIVDIGTGGADIPMVAMARARRRGRGWRITAVDNRADVLDRAATNIPEEAGISIRLGDARRLPFADEEFDVAHSSLMLHHLDPQDAITALREMARVARIGIVVNDLRRGLLAFAMAAPVLAFARSPMTRHDGIVSLRRAYTLRELDAMLDEAGLEIRWRSNPLLPRVVTAAVPRGKR